jgi:hypothetical protein
MYVVSNSSVVQIATGYIYTGENVCQYIRHEAENLTSNMQTWGGKLLNGLGDIPYFMVKPNIEYEMRGPQPLRENLNFDSLSLVGD